MSYRTSSWRSLMPGLGMSVALALVILGVVMADTHVPVAIEPDAPRAGGASVATFALG